MITEAGLSWYIESVGRDKFHTLVSTEDASAYLLRNYKITDKVLKQAVQSEVKQTFTAAYAQSVAAGKSKRVATEKAQRLAVQRGAQLALKNGVKGLAAEALADAYRPGSGMTGAGAFAGNLILGAAIDITLNYGIAALRDRTGTSIAKRMEQAGYWEVQEKYINYCSGLAVRQGNYGQGFDWGIARGRVAGWTGGSDIPEFGWGGEQFERQHTFNLETWDYNPVQNLREYRASLGLDDRTVEERIAEMRARFRALDSDPNMNPESSVSPFDLRAELAMYTEAVRLRESSRQFYEHRDVQEHQRVMTKSYTALAVIGVIAFFVIVIALASSSKQ